MYVFLPAPGMLCNYTMQYVAAQGPELFGCQGGGQSLKSDRHGKATKFEGKNKHFAVPKPGGKAEMVRAAAFMVGKIAELWLSGLLIKGLNRMTAEQVEALSLPKVMCSRAMRRRAAHGICLRAETRSFPSSPPKICAMESAIMVYMTLQQSFTPRQSTTISPSSS